MKTREVKREGWDAFCKKVNKVLNGSMVHIERVARDGRVEVLAAEEPFRSLIFRQQSNECNDLLIVKTGTDEPVQHVITEPIHIRLKNGDNDRYNHLHILAEDGTTVIDVNPGLSPAALQGIQTT